MMKDQMSKDTTINGHPATQEQFARVMFLQEKKRRIQAEAKLLVFEEQQVDAELDVIVAAIGAAVKDVEEVKEGAA